MGRLVIPAAFAVAAAGFLTSPAPASTKGCLKGAVIGGVAGHFAGHHGLLGAGAGCVIGHHEAKKHARERERAYEQEKYDHAGYGSSTPNGDHGYSR
jgi:hypothetical protein